MWSHTFENKHLVLPVSWNYSGGVAFLSTATICRLLAVEWTVSGRDFLGKPYLGVGGHVSTRSQLLIVFLEVTTKKTKKKNLTLTNDKFMNCIVLVLILIQKILLQDTNAILSTVNVCTSSHVRLTVLTISTGSVITEQTVAAVVAGTCCFWMPSPHGASWCHCDISQSPPPSFLPLQGKHRDIY